MATVYLSPTGSDSNTYAQAQNPATPWLSMTKVQASATTGDTVVCAAGTYLTPITAKLSLTKSFTVVGAALVNGLPTTIFDFTAYCATPFGTVQYNAISNTALQTWSNVMFQNYVVQNTNYGALLTPTANWTFTNGVWRNNVTQIPASNYGGLILVGAANTTITLNSCVFYGCTGFTGTGTGQGYISARDGVVSCTVITNNCTFESRTASSDRYGNIFYWGGGVGYLLTAKNNIYNNVTGQTVNFASNTLGAGSSSNSSDRYNLTLTYEPAGGTGNITSDPLLVNGANGNFNTRPSSPCRGVGTLP